MAELFRVHPSEKWPMLRQFYVQAGLGNCTNSNMEHWCFKDAQQLHCSNTNILHTYVAKLHIAYTPHITYNSVLYYAGDQPAVYHYIMHVSVPMFGILCTGAQQTYHVSYVPTYYDVWYFTPHTPSNSSFSATSNSYFWLPQPTSPWFQVSSMFTMSPN